MAYAALARAKASFKGIGSRDFKGFLRILRSYASMKKIYKSSVLWQIISMGPLPA
jgi:hypothetical protein